jgi:AcrR family transcriptional regulator
VNERSFQISEPGKVISPQVVAPESSVTDNQSAEASDVAKNAGTKKAKRGRPAKGAQADQDNRERILRAAEALFSTQGFHGTGLREVAEKAGVSLGNIYNHFDDKEELFGALLKSLEKEYLSPEQPLVKALFEADFPDEIEKLGHASRDTVKKFASYIRLIYIDVLEFKGKHVARLYGGMRDRYTAVYGERFAKLKKDGKLSDADPVMAALMCTMTYMFYFTIEHLFGVKNHLGMDDDQVIREFAKVLRLGVLKR